MRERAVALPSRSSVQVVTGRSRWLKADQRPDGARLGRRTGTPALSQALRREFGLAAVGADSRSLLFHFLSVVCHCRLRGPNDRRPPDAAFRGNARHPRVTSYFTLARKLGVGSVPMSACLDSAAAAPGVPAATPFIAGDWRVTCAVY
jgi:hypothetical protein